MTRCGEGYNLEKKCKKNCKAIDFCENYDIIPAE
jgi:hypothetical protein